MSHIRHYIAHRERAHAVVARDGNAIDVYADWKYWNTRVLHNDWMVVVTRRELWNQINQLGEQLRGLRDFLDYKFVGRAKRIWLDYIGPLVFSMDLQRHKVESV